MFVFYSVLLTVFILAGLLSVVVLQVIKGGFGSVSWVHWVLEGLCLVVYKVLSCVLVVLMVVLFFHVLLGFSYLLIELMGFGSLVSNLFNSYEFSLFGTFKEFKQLIMFFWLSSMLTCIFGILAVGYFEWDLVVTVVKAVISGALFVSFFSSLCIILILLMALSGVYHFSGFLATIKVSWSGMFDQMAIMLVSLTGIMLMVQIDSYVVMKVMKVVLVCFLSFVFMWKLVGLFMWFSGVELLENYLVVVLVPVNLSQVLWELEVMVILLYSMLLILLDCDSIVKQVKMSFVGVLFGMMFAGLYGLLNSFVVSNVLWTESTPLGWVLGLSFVEEVDLDQVYFWLVMVWALSGVILVMMTIDSDLVLMTVLILKSCLVFILYFFFYMCVCLFAMTIYWFLQSEPYFLEMYFWMFISFVSGGMVLWFFILFLSGFSLGSVSNERRFARYVSLVIFCILFYCHFML